MKKDKGYLSTFAEIGIIIILLLLLMFTAYGSVSSTDKYALIFTLISTIVYAVYTVCYYLAYNGYVYVKWGGNENRKKLMYVVMQSIAHLFLGVTIVDYFYLLSDTQTDIIYLSVIILSAIITLVDFLIRYKNLLDKKD